MAPRRSRGTSAVLLLGNELVEILEALVITHVRGQSAVVIDAEVGALVLEPPQSGVLAGNRFGIMWVDFDDVAEPVRLCRVIRLRRRNADRWPPAVDARPVFQPIAAAAERG